MNTYTYLFKYIIIGDPSNPKTTQAWENLVS